MKQNARPGAGPEAAPAGGVEGGRAPAGRPRLGRWEGYSLETLTAFLDAWPTGEAHPQEDGPRRRATTRPPSVSGPGGPA